MSELENTDVRINVQTTGVKYDFLNIVNKLIAIRKEAGFSQQFIADLLEVDRRKIIALESGELFDILLLEKYADKLDIKLNINNF